MWNRIVLLTHCRGVCEGVLEVGPHVMGVGSSEAGVLEVGPCDCGSGSRRRRASKDRLWCSGPYPDESFRTTVNGSLPQSRGGALTLAPLSLSPSLNGSRCVDCPPSSTLPLLSSFVTVSLQISTLSSTPFIWSLTPLGGRDHTSRTRSPSRS